MGFILRDSLAEYTKTITYHRRLILERDAWVKAVSRENDSFHSGISLQKRDVRGRLWLKSSNCYGSGQLQSQHRSTLNRCVMVWNICRKLTQCKSTIKYEYGKSRYGTMFSAIFLTYTHSSFPFLAALWCQWHLLIISFGSKNSNVHFCKDYLHKKLLFQLIKLYNQNT